MADPKVLFLVDDQQAEVPEFDRLAKQRVSADHDVDRAIAQALLHFCQLLRRDKAGSLCDLDRKAPKTLGKRFGVLTSQQRRRHHDRDLLAVERDRESSPQRHLGLAEANIAADEPIHRPTSLKVFERGIDRAKLIFGFVVRKTRTELVIN